ncbi:MAG: phosphate signaling complex protein PhoU [Christensenellales bacterium]|nr:phosphate signaling complex protein PhoU [Clostridia bacterium]
MTTRKNYDEELCSLKKSLTAMCLAVERMIEDSIKALAEQDEELARSVAARDEQVDETELDIEKRCLRLLLIEQPVARDFREVSTALKLITDIERIGDQASDIAEIVADLKDETYIKKLTHTIKMGRLAVKMVHDGVASFINGDEKLADETIARDDEMDALFVTVKNELAELIRKDSSNADQAIMFMMIAKYLERIGDHAVNVCEWTKYFETGIHTKY